MEELEAKLDASNERLEAKIDASQMRLEAMFQQLLACRSPVYSTPPVSLRDNYRTVSVMLPILADEPTNRAKEKEIASPKLTMQVGGRNAELVVDKGCVGRGRRWMRHFHRWTWTLEQLGQGQVHRLGLRISSRYPKPRENIFNVGTVYKPLSKDM